MQRSSLNAGNVLPYPVTIEQTKNRSSRAIIRNGEIVVRLAWRLSMQERERHIHTLVRRITAAHARDKQRQRIDPFSPLLRGVATSIDIPCAVGEPVRMRVVPGSRLQIVSHASLWTITRPDAIAEKVLERSLWKILTIAKEVEMASLVRSINEATLRVPITHITLKPMRTRWGSCGHGGVIALSTALLLTTPALVEYVIIHELAHVRHMNHSKRFWALVEAHCPHMQTSRAMLRTYALQQRAL